MIEKNKFFKYIILTVISFSIILYFIFFAMKFIQVNDSISAYKTEIEKLKIKINKEKNKNKSIINVEENDINNMYFNKERDIFEDYIQNILNKYKMETNLYQSVINENNYAEIFINITLNAVDFFNLLYDIENDKKFISISSLSVKKEKNPYLNVIIKIGGYYK